MGVITMMLTESKLETGLPKTTQSICPECGITIPAKLIEKDGAVYDPQWRNYGAAYFGIEFTREYLTNRFNFFLKREQETGQPMIPFLCADDFDESVANLHGAFAMVAPSSNCPHHALDDPACRSCEILPVTGHRVLFLTADKRPDCKCVHPFGSKFVCVCPNQRERYWPANSSAS